MTTAYGGGFVQSIDGLGGSKSARRDWFYYVDGSQPNVGAADYAVGAGDVVQWDYHRWDATIRVPAVVGAYPLPFTRAPGGRHPRTVVECAADTAAPCAEVVRRLRSVGSSITRAPLGAAPGRDSVLVVVARWSSARRVAALRAIEAGPAVSGVFARFDAGGRTLELLDGAGRLTQTAAAGSGLLAATEGSDGTPTWAFTGVDTTGVARAAGALERERLDDAFALAVGPAGTRRLPLGGTP